MSKFTYTNDHDQRYQLVVEQLEICADLIKSKSPNKARMALLLLDNLADILMLRYCNYRFSEDAFFSLYLKPKYTKQQVQKAKDSIQGKVEFLRDKAKRILTKKDETIIFVCHSYRNSAQHNDEHNPETTLAFARVFFDMVSNLFVKIQHDGHATYYGNSVPDWAKKYISGDKVVYKDLASVVAKKLRIGIAIDLSNLKKVFISDIEKRIRDIEEIIDELPVKETRGISHMLRMYEYEQSDQYKSLAANAYDAKFRLESGTVTYHQYGKLNSGVRSKDEVLRKNYRPSVTYDTYSKIKRSYKSLLKEKDLHATLRAYERFNKPLEKLESLFLQARGQWYEYQDLLVDIARGK